MNLRLLVVQGLPRGKCMVFPPGEYIVGRGAECHVRTESDWVSRQHCLLHVGESQARLRDLASRNGTLVNGVRLVGECTLTHDDLLQVGPLTFQVQIIEPAVDEESVVLGDTVMNGNGSAGASASSETLPPARAEQRQAHRAEVPPVGDTPTA